jgi:nitroreductase
MVLGIDHKILVGQIDFRLVTSKENLMTKGVTQMSVMDAINGRRSVRSYMPGKLDAGTIRAILAAAVRAPTAIHQEPWSFLIVQDPAALKDLSDRAKVLIHEDAKQAHLARGGHALDAFAAPDFDVFYAAGTLVVICGPAGPFVPADCWLAAENLMLSAFALGLGTCVIGCSLAALNSPEVKAELGIPSELSAIVPVIVGVPSGETPPTTRKEARILAWK